MFPEIILKAGIAQGFRDCNGLSGDGARQKWKILECSSSGMRPQFYVGLL